MVDGIRLEPNGTFVETVIEAVMQRIEYYQDSKFSCDENKMAIANLKAALSWLNQRTKNREERNVEGTYQV